MTPEERAGAALDVFVARCRAPDPLHLAEATDVFVVAIAAQIRAAVAEERERIKVGEWTTDAPTVSGSYWLKLSGVPDVDLVTVDVSAGGVEVYFPACASPENPAFRPEYAGAKWCGPLVPPGRGV